MDQVSKRWRISYRFDIIVKILGEDNNKQNAIFQFLSSWARFVSQTLPRFPPLTKLSNVAALSLPPVASPMVIIVITIVMVIVIIPVIAGIVVTVIIINPASCGRDTYNQKQQNCY